MAYDSATDTALAGQAYQRALVTSQQNRTRLNSQFGLNADGSLDTSAAGELGSIYQGNLASENATHNAELSDASRGFGSSIGGVGGLAGKATAAARANALNTQAENFANANSQLGANSQEQATEGQDYQNALGIVGSKSAFDLAQTLAANPVLGPDATAAGTPAAPTPVAGLTGTAKFAQMYAANPTKYATVKGKF